MPRNSGGAKGLCARCYKRKQRGLPEAPKRLKAPDGQGDQVTFRLPRELMDRVIAESVASGTTRADVLRRAVATWFKRQL